MSKRRRLKNQHRLASKVIHPNGSKAISKMAYEQSNFLFSIKCNKAKLQVSNDLWRVLFHVYLIDLLSPKPEITRSNRISFNPEKDTQFKMIFPSRMRFANDLVRWRGLLISVLWQFLTNCFFHRSYSCCNISNCFISNGWNEFDLIWNK